MQAVTNLVCPSCGRSNGERELVCGLCGTVLRRERAEPDVESAPIAGGSIAPLASAHHPYAHGPYASGATGGNARGPALHGISIDVALERTDVGRQPWIFLAIGLATAPIFAWTPILRFMGWFLSSLVHEMGHAAFAWLCGMPAFPAISLEGHAAAMHSEQIVPLACLTAAALAYAAWRWLEGHARWIAVALVVLVYPAIAFTKAREVLHLVAGHGGELAFATLCFWRTLHGGFTRSNVERALYGTVGWYLLGINVSLCWGLMRSSAARVAYYGNGSFGMTNDYIRVAEDVLECRLQSVAVVMLVLAMLVLPVGMLLWRTTGATSASEIELD